MEAAGSRSVIQRNDIALKKLQVSLNIVRSNVPKLKNDFWLPMREVHLDIVREYE